MKREKLSKILQGSETPTLDEIEQMAEKQEYIDSDFREEFEKETAQYAVDVKHKIYDSDTERYVEDINFNYVGWLEKKLHTKHTELQEKDKAIQEMIDLYEIDRKLKHTVSYHFLISRLKQILNK